MPQTVLIACNIIKSVWDYGDLIKRTMASKWIEINCLLLFYYDILMRCMIHNVDTTLDWFPQAR